MMARCMPRLKPCAARPQASARTSSAYCCQVQVCQMPRSFSRIAGRAPRTRAWCISSFGNVSSVPASMVMEPSSVSRRILAQNLRYIASGRTVKAMNGKEHWTRKGDVKLFLWQKSPATAVKGTILFVHGSSMASQPTFDLQVPGRPDSSAMEWFAARGFDTWCLDNEGYGRSDKSRPINCDISNGADDVAVASRYIDKKLLVYGISSGALKAALVDPAKITVPTLVLRGEFDGIAGIDDLLKFFLRLPHPDKQFSVMEGISHASFQQKNYLTVYHLLHGFFTRPDPVYRG